MERAGVKEMSIWMEGSDSYLYMRCDDYKQTTQKLNASPESVRWEEAMEPMLRQGDGTDYEPQDAYPDGLPVIFRWECSAFA